MRWWPIVGVLLVRGALATPPADLEEDGVEVRGQRPDARAARDRSVTRVGRKDLDRQQARSTPDALKFAPGVYVQQTGHGQASPYIRGRTGQNTLLLFDGLRINHALFRQGPNQYLFTVDSRTIDHLDVVRGSASVEYGADAMTGAVLITPLDPRIDPTRRGTHAEALLAVRHATQDGEIGGRAHLDVQLGPATGLLVGVGGRTVGQLESAGSVGHLLGADEAGAPLFEKQVPTFEDDGRTMLGTGFDEWTADARLVHRFDDEQHVTAAAYIYRQSDAPRTDQCPPPEANLAECLVYDAQNRTQVYARSELSPGWLFLDRFEAAFGFQRQFERRVRDQEATLGARNGGEDGIDVFGGRLFGAMRPLALGAGLRLRAAFGADASTEAVTSSAFTELTRIDVRRAAPRGQYVDDSAYRQGGIWLSPRLEWRDRVALRVGARLAGAAAVVPGEAESATEAVDETWGAIVANAGLEVTPGAGLTLIANIEQGFRPPNLDDVSARQPTGRGFQLENADLDPERALTYEAGVEWAWRRLSLEGWAFLTRIDRLLERRIAECPPGDRECRGARVAVQLVNVEGVARIKGLEATARLKSWRGLRGRASVAWAEGESDSPVAGADERVPLSRIPPLNGTAELTWDHADTGLYVGGAVRWATDQTRLSVGDEADARVPFGGTPGYAVLDARLGLRTPRLLLAFVFENLGDAPYRVHGSAINGPGRGVLVNVEVRPEIW